MHGEGYVSADLGREVGIETKPLQVNAQHLRKRKARRDGVVGATQVTSGGSGGSTLYIYLREFDNAHLLLAVLKSVNGKEQEKYTYNVHVHVYTCIYVVNM